MTKRHIVKLSCEEREYLRGLVGKGRIAAYKRRHAEIVLKADAGKEGPGWTDKRIAEAFDVSIRGLEHLRKRFVEEGLEAALKRKKQCRPSVEPKLDGEKEARLIALSCSTPPEGRSRWTLRLLADRLVVLDVVESISYETVRQALKKTT